MGNKRKKTSQLCIFALALLLCGSWAQPSFAHPCLPGSHAEDMSACPALSSQASHAGMLHDMADAGSSHAHGASPTSDQEAGNGSCPMQLCSSTHSPVAMPLDAVFFHAPETTLAAGQRDASTSSLYRTDLFRPPRSLAA